jgi:hypothetical protein
VRDAFVSKVSSCDSGAGVALVVVWMRGALAARAVNIAASLLSLALAGGGSGGGGIDTALPRP